METQHREGGEAGPPSRLLPIPAASCEPGQTGEEGGEGDLLEAAKWTKQRVRYETYQNITEGGKRAIPLSVTEGSGYGR